MRQGMTSTQIIYILAIIIFACVLILGYKYIGGLSKESEQLQIIEFEKDLQSSIKKTASQYESGTVDKFKIPPKYTEMCFINTTNKSELPSAFVKAFPLVADSIETGENVFLMGDDLEAFNFEKIIIDDKVLCIPVKDGEVKVRLIGTGEDAVVQAIDATSEYIEEGLVEEEIVIVSNDYLAMLEIPAGVSISYPAEEGIIVVQESAAPDNIDSMEAAGDIYEFQPIGTEFDSEVPLILLYDDTTDQDNLIIMADEGDGWEELEGPFEIDPEAQTIMVDVDSLAKFVVVVPSQDTDSISSATTYSCIDAYCSGTNKYVFPSINGIGQYNAYPSYCEGDFWINLTGSSLESSCSTGWQVITDCRYSDGSIIPDCPYDPSETRAKVAMDISQIENISEMSFVLDIDGDGSDEVVSINIGNSTKDGSIHIEPLIEKIFHPTWHWKIFEPDGNSFIETASGTYSFGSNETYQYPSPSSNTISGNLPIEDAKKCIVNGTYGEEMFLDYYWDNESFLGLKRLCIGYKGESLYIHPCTVKNCNARSLSQDVEVELGIQKTYQNVGNVIDYSLANTFYIYLLSRSPPPSTITLNKDLQYYLYWNSKNAVNCQGLTNIHYLQNLFNVADTSGIYLYPDFYSPMEVVYTITCTGPMGQTASASASVNYEDIDAVCNFDHIFAEYKYFNITENAENYFKVKPIIKEKHTPLCIWGYEQSKRGTNIHSEFMIPSSEDYELHWSCYGLDDGSNEDCSARVKNVECGGLADAGESNTKYHDYVFGIRKPENGYCGDSGDCSETFCSFYGMPLNYTPTTYFVEDEKDNIRIQSKDRSTEYIHIDGYWEWTCKGFAGEKVPCKAFRADRYLMEKRSSCDGFNVQSSCQGDVIASEDIGGDNCIDFCEKTPGTSCCSVMGGLCYAINGTITSPDYYTAQSHQAAMCYGDNIYIDASAGVLPARYKVEYPTYDLFKNPMRGYFICNDFDTVNRWCTELGYDSGAIISDYRSISTNPRINVGHEFQRFMKFENNAWQYTYSAQYESGSSYAASEIKCFK